MEYEVYDRGDSFFMLLRDTDRPNSELLVAPISNPTEQTVCPVKFSSHTSDCCMLFKHFSLLIDSLSKNCFLNRYK